MNLRFAIVLAVALSAAACKKPPSNAPPPPDPELSLNVAREIARLFQESGREANRSNATVRSSGHSVRVLAYPGRTVEQQSGITVAIDVVLEVDGTANPAFHVAAVGIGESMLHARITAVREWSIAYGIPIVNALLGTSEPVAFSSPDGSTTAYSSTRPLDMGTYRVYPGPTGVRGEVPEGWADRGTETMHRAFLGLFQPALTEVFPSRLWEGFHSFKLTLHVRNGAAGQAECRVDSVLHFRLCELARSYPWPREQGDFIFKQFYVLAPRTR